MTAADRQRLARQLRGLRQRILLTAAEAVAKQEVTSIFDELDAIESIARAAADAVESTPGSDDLAERIERVALTMALAGPLEPHGDHVYILWTGEHEPLYVGRSSNVLARVGTHMQDPAKFAATTSVTLLRLPDVQTASLVELRLIASLRPSLNTVGMGRQPA